MKNVIVKDLGFTRAIGVLREAGTSYVAVGVQGELQRKEGEATQAEVANYMEFGTETIPARSFMRSTFDEQQKNLSEIKRRLLTQISFGKISVEQGLGQIGAWFVGKVQAKIASNVPPPLAQSTIDKKGSSVSLIDTGQLRQSITFTVKKHGE